jgi:hypothetical protein
MGFQDAFNIWLSPMTSGTKHTQPYWWIVSTTGTVCPEKKRNVNRSLQTIESGMFPHCRLEILAKKQTIK